MKDRIESIILQYSMTDAEASHLSDELFKLFAQQNTLTLDNEKALRKEIEWLRNEYECTSGKANRLLEYVKEKGLFNEYFDTKVNNVKN